MRASHILQIIGAVVAIILGILFAIYLPHDIGDVTTDAFFVGVGGLLLRSTILDSRKKTTATAVSNKAASKNNTTAAQRNRKEKKKK